MYGLQDLDYVLRLLYKTRADSLKDIVYRGDYEISSESDSASVSAMVLRDNWPTKLEAGSKLDMTALLHRLQSGQVSPREMYTCPVCSTDNSDAPKSRSGIVW